MFSEPPIYLLQEFLYIVWIVGETGVADYTQSDLFCA